MPITITVTDGTTTANPITIEDTRIAATTAALSAMVGDLTPPANPARAIRQALDAWIKGTRKQGRSSTVRQASDLKLRADLLLIDADEIKAP